VAGLGPVAAGIGLHPVFEEEQLFVEVVEGCTAWFLIGGEGAVERGGEFGIVEWLAAMTAVGERSGDADGAERVETIGVLHDAAFDGWHFGGDARAFEREVGDDRRDMFDRGFVNAERREPFAGDARSGRFVAVMELPIREVVQKRGEFDNEGIGTFGSGELQRDAADAVRVMPVVARAFAGKCGADVIGGAREDFLVGELCGHGVLTGKQLVARSGDRATTRGGHGRGCKWTMDSGQLRIDGALWPRDLILGTLGEFRYGVPLRIAACEKGSVIDFRCGRALRRG
jgi:hypothetical protein